MIPINVRLSESPSHGKPALLYDIESRRAQAYLALGRGDEAVAMLVNILAGLGEHLPAGSFVMSGGITEAIAVKPGDSVTARFQELGSVSMRFVD